MAKKTNHQVRVYNCSKQMIPLQARSPGGDFYTNEQQVRISPGQDVLLPKSHLRQDQLENLQKRGLIRIIYDSEMVEEKQQANS